MSRERKLLPRLMAALDTLENDAEIVATLRHVRRIVGKDWFNALMNAAEAPPVRDVSMVHEEYEIAIRLRGLGLMLRLAQHPHPDVAAALHRTSEALVEGGTADERDLLVTLACLRDLLMQGAEEQQNIAMMTRPPLLNNGTSIRDDLRASMETLFGRTRQP